VDSFSHLNLGSSWKVKRERVLISPSPVKYSEEFSKYYNKIPLSTLVSYPAFGFLTLKSPN